MLHRIIPKLYPWIAKEFVHQRRFNSGFPRRWHRNVKMGKTRIPASSGLGARKDAHREWKGVGSDGSGSRWLRQTENRMKEREEAWNWGRKSQGGAVLSSRVRLAAGNSYVAGTWSESWHLVMSQGRRQAKWRLTCGPDNEFSQFDPNAPIALLQTKFQNMNCWAQKNIKIGRLAGIFKRKSFCLGVKVKFEKDLK
jgi:hypothetical protein